MRVSQVVEKKLRISREKNLMKSITKRQSEPRQQESEEIVNFSYDMKDQEIILNKSKEKHS